ncbi:HAD family hydrolase [Stygiolobus caldivivus]|uniref:Uncharacterized protein n=1 Tax=Stygiolobus caldivivus TaxID=2824673 RepID=A0A8D5U4J9_9CREN|nr:HAD family hydrolase [Stygiolobus caldivivus]BCU69132.1 hypothetical protein KN1_04290 [Stygiolobus caldivivus]
MNYAIWLDGVVLKIDLTDVLYRKYKGEKIEEIGITRDVFCDWPDFLNKLKESVKLENVVFLSPYNKDTTRHIMENIGLSEFRFISNDSGVTKPSRAPFQVLFQLMKWEPMETITIGASPIDLLSARFYDSRIKVACVKRFQDCSRYSPYIMAENLGSLYETLKRLRKL